MKKYLYYFILMSFLIILFLIIFYSDSLICHNHDHELYKYFNEIDINNENIKSNLTEYIEYINNESMNFNKVNTSNDINMKNPGKAFENKEILSEFENDKYDETIEQINIKYDSSNRLILHNMISISPEDYNNDNTYNINNTNSYMDSHLNNQNPHSDSYLTDNLFTAINFRSFIKMDNGKFSSIIIIKQISSKSIGLFNIRNSLMLKYDLNFTFKRIISIVNSQLNEDSYFYCLIQLNEDTHSRVVVKFEVSLFGNKESFNWNENENEDNKQKEDHYQHDDRVLNIKTYKKDHIKDYDIYQFYMRSLKRLNFIINPVLIIRLSTLSEITLKTVMESIKNVKVIVINLEVFLKNAQTQQNSYNEEYFSSVKSYFSKGNKGLTIETEKYIFYINDNETTDDENRTDGINNNLKGVLLKNNISIRKYFSFLGFVCINYKNYKESTIEIRSITNNALYNKISLLIDIGRKNKILSFHFDQINNIFYILSNELKLYIVSPRIVSREDSSKNSYVIQGIICLYNKFTKKDQILLDEMNLNDNNNPSILIIRRDLIIKVKDYIIFIDITQISLADELNTLNYELFPFSIYKINSYIGNTLVLSNLSDILYLKTPIGNYLLIEGSLYNKSHDHSYRIILFFQYHHHNSSFIGEENLSFNFKIPVILIALVILIIYHLFIKKPDGGNIPDEGNLKEELIKELKNFGAFEKKTEKKEENLKYPYVEDFNKSHNEYEEEVEVEGDVEDE